jgi:hypothetical protein
MRKVILIMSMVLAGFATQVKAQFVVTDPAHIATSIANTANQIVQTSSTATNMVNNWREVQKVYNQTKDYYDKLKSINNLVQDARKVRDAILLVGEIGDIYVNSFQKMLADPNFRYEELIAISNGYAMMLSQSANMLLEMRDVVNINGLSMTDAERMGIISYVYERLRNQRNLVDYYTRKNISVSYLRAKKNDETDGFLSLYGNANERYW